MQATTFGIWVLSLAVAVSAQAGNAVKPGALVHERPSAECVDFIWQMSGDVNRSARIEAENRKVGNGAWRPCSTTVRVNNDEWLDLYTVTIGVKGLDPASEYEFRFRLTDPDGVEGEAGRSARVKTPKLHAYEPQWEKHSTDYSKREPVLRIGDGDTVQTKSWMWNYLNGPFYIEGAEPGDTLAVRLELVEPEGRGESGGALVRRAVDPQTAGELPESHGSSKWTIDREAGMATVTEVTVFLRVGSESKPTKVDTRAVGLRVPLEPMIGDMGVAVDAPLGKAPHMVDCGRHGGNLDWKGVKAGTTMYYPVYVQGGLYYISDGHAAQGAGEPLMMGIAAVWRAMPPGDTAGHFFPFTQAERAASCRRP